MGIPSTPLPSGKLFLKSRNQFGAIWSPQKRDFLAWVFEGPTQSRDERTEIHCKNLHGPLHRVGETGGKQRKGRIQKVLTDKDFSRQNDLRVCRGYWVTSNLRRVMPLVSWLYMSFSQNETGLHFPGKSRRSDTPVHVCMCLQNARNKPTQRCAIARSRQGSSVAVGEDANLRPIVSSKDVVTSKLTNLLVCCNVFLQHGLKLFYHPVDNGTIQLKKDHFSSEFR